MHLGRTPRSTSQIEPRSRRRLALFAALVLSAAALVLVAGEARAQQQLEIVKQVVPASATPHAEEDPAAANKVSAEPVDQAVTVEGPAAVPSFPPNPAPEKTPNTSLSGDPTKPVIEKPEATKTAAALSEEPPARVLVRPEPEPERAPGDPNLAPPISASVSAPISVPASKPSPKRASEPVVPEQSSPLPTPTTEGEGLATTQGLGLAALLPEEDSKEDFFLESTPPPETNISADDSAAAPIEPILAPSSSPPADVPVWAVEGGLPNVSSSFETTANALGSVMEAVRSATTSAAADVLQILVGGAPEPSSSDGAQSSPTQEEGTTQPPSPPAAPPLPPMGEGPLYSSSGSGLASPGSGFVVLLLGVLALGLVLLLRRDGPLFLAAWEVPKPSSALLSPLERPG